MHPSIALLSAVLVFSCLDLHKVEGYSFEPLRRSKRDKSTSTTEMLIVPERIGCYGDKWSRALRVHHYFFNNAEGLTKDAKVQRCAEVAHKRNWKMFGVQWYGECWGDSEAESRYDMYGRSDKCSNGLGGGLANDIYRFKLFCHSDGYNFKIGELMYTPSSYSSISEANCGFCECGPNGPTNCRKLYCDLKIQQSHCEKWTNGAPAGQCCPVCLCVHDGALENEGSKWVVRTKDKCSKCVCRDGKTKCETQAIICTPCANPLYVKGECCPVCGPTNEPVFTIPPTKSGPIFPPLPPQLR